MKITPATRKKKLLYPMAAAVVLAGCQQQQQQGGVPPLPLEVCTVPAVKPQGKNEASPPQRVVGRKAVRQGREKNQPLPGKRRASR